MKQPYIYPGNELLLFQQALKWKKYFSHAIRPYVKGKVLEVGAGLGANTTWLNNSAVTSITLLEPDEKLFTLLEEKKRMGKFPDHCKVVKGKLEVIGHEQFDTIVYLDVLEHIEDDKEELARAALLLATGGHLVVLSPAFQFLYSPFDKAIGHYRRYSRKSFKKVTPPATTLVRMYYLDTAGFFASLVNRLFLRQSYPTVKQVYLWDKWMIPISMISDRLFFHSFGKSIVAILQKTL